MDDRLVVIVFELGLTTVDAETVALVPLGVDDVKQAFLNGLGATM